MVMTSHDNHHHHRHHRHCHHYHHCHSDNTTPGTTAATRRPLFSGGEKFTHFGVLSRKIAPGKCFYFAYFPVFWQPFVAVWPRMLPFCFCLPLLMFPELAGSQRLLLAVVTSRQVCHFAHLLLSTEAQQSSSKRDPPLVVHFSPRFPLPACITITIINACLPAWMIGYDQHRRRRPEVRDRQTDQLARRHSFIPTLFSSAKS